MEHKHIYNDQGEMVCCTLEEKIYRNAGSAVIDEAHRHKANVRKHGVSQTAQIIQAIFAERFKIFIPAIVSFVLLATGLILDHFITTSWFSGWLRICFYTLAYVPVGLPVLKEAVQSIAKGELFSEFFLMGIATIGAFIIGEYPEGVAVMLFYSVGEIFQMLAVSKAKKNIQSLIDQRPDNATVIRNGATQTVKAADVQTGEIIQLKPGEKLSLDGKLLSEKGMFDTAALTGESVPDTKTKGEYVLAGMINLNTVTQVKTTALYNDSKLSKILDLVQNAASKKAPTELFIRKFAKVYTPIVVFAALAIWLLPYFFVSTYSSSEWLYRALVFLVVSCPCALVVSIPLGYFGGIGAASRNGILVKGGNFLDTLANLKQVVMDKTGTLTEGVFKVQFIVFEDRENKEKILKWVNALESHSTHPVATAIHNYVGEVDNQIVVENFKEISGLGLIGEIEGKELLAGSFKLLDKYNISYPVDPASIVDTTIAIAYDRKYMGLISIADTIKKDAKTAVDNLHRLSVKTTILSGDKSTIVEYVADKLGIDTAYGDLLPADKVEKVNKIKAQSRPLAFVGDGINDAPVVAFSDVGMAMGGLGSDATIETADVVIQDDNPAKIPVAINIGKQTKRIVWQNISMAFIIKLLVILLGAAGIATMWEAVFADVGVALLAILNAVRIQRMKF